MRCISRRAPSITLKPGPGLEGLGDMVECDQMLTMSMARSSSSRAASSNASDTRIGYALPTSASLLMRPGAAPAVSSAASEPMLWPISIARSTPAASSSASSQALMSSMLASAGPALRPWPGRSTASTL